MSPALRPLRKREPMPDFVREALDVRGLWAAYQARPPYQRNDYLLWINKVKRQETKVRHLAQMLDELEAGDVYMGMRWNGARGPAGES
ncbi:YdeI/OmpD-associated family protein [Pelagibacterium mangrovi]|uniref:YdeI/OmpD-associated family protein n=1 Tax=Pelagibacterium mangrovi TaxID=3119828 RepID=UPI002FCBA971